MIILYHAFYSCSPAHYNTQSPIDLTASCSGESPKDPFSGRWEGQLAPHFQCNQTNDSKAPLYTSSKVVLKDRKRLHARYLQLHQAGEAVILISSHFLEIRALPRDTNIFSAQHYQFVARIYSCAKPLLYRRWAIKGSSFLD